MAFLLEKSIYSGEKELESQNPLQGEVTIDRIIKINDAILRHLSNCENCHLKEILKEALANDKK